MNSLLRRSALYARVSSEAQAQQGTIESQLAAVKAFAAAQGLQVDPDLIFADNGVSALDLLRGQLRPCLILLDYHMPVMDGLTFRERQAADPMLADIPVVLYSGAHDIGRMADALAIPHVFQKPLNLNDLVDLVHRYC